VLHEVGGGWFASAREFRPGDSLGDAVGTTCRGVKWNIRLGSEGDLNAPWELVGPDSA
jgi:hypothetical protein